MAALTVLVMQLVAPWVRERGMGREGPGPELLFAAPFVLFFLPYVVWTIAVRPSFGWSAVAVTGAIAGALLLQAVVWREWSPRFERDLLELLPPLPRGAFLLRSYQLLASAVTQELFYHGVLFVLLRPVIGAAAVPVTTALFTLEHYGNRWAAAAHKPQYYLRISALSLWLGALVYTERSLWAGILGHVAFNAAPVVQLAYHHRVTRAAELRRPAV